MGWHNDGWDWHNDEDQCDQDGKGRAIELTIWAISLVELALGCWILFW